MQKYVFGKSVKYANNRSFYCSLIVTQIIFNNALINILINKSARLVQQRFILHLRDLRKYLDKNFSRKSLFKETFVSCILVTFTHSGYLIKCNTFVL